MNDSFLSKSYKKREKKRIKYGALICCLITLLLFFIFFELCLYPQPTWDFQLQMGVDLKMQAVKAAISDQKQIVESSKLENKEAVRATQKIQPILCNTEEKQTEFCEINTDARVDANSSSVFAVSLQIPSITTIRPYARKDDPRAMRKAKQWSTLLEPAESLEEIPRCTQSHGLPAVLFSLGGYSGNNYHDFFDIAIPLFTTSRQYNGEVHFFITDYKSSYVTKFQKVLKGLFKYEPINIDKENDKVHCFPSVIIGLKRSPNGVDIDATKHSTSMKEFQDFLRRSFSLNRAKAIRIGDNLRHKKPRLLLISRQKTRAFVNAGEIGEMARRLGYKVTVAEAESNLERFSETVNSCDVLMGVHGAGLTNIFFLPENAVFIQVLPFGGFEWMANEFYGQPSIDLNLNYLEYKISREESTLIEQYLLDHTIFTDPLLIKNQGWDVFKSIYMNKQSVNLDVNRFKLTLVEALKLLHK